VSKTYIAGRGLVSVCVPAAGAIGRMAE
jgi:hypothetical protein